MSSLSDGSSNNSVFGSSCDNHCKSLEALEHTAIEPKQTLSAVIENLKYMAASKSFKTNIELRDSSFTSIKKSSSVLGFSPAAPLPNEPDRLAVIKELNFPSTPQAPYDNLTALAARLTSCPISCVSLVEEDRQFFVSHHGLDASQTPREYSFCAHAIHHPDAIFEVEDTQTDERFRQNPLVTENPNIRFYAGVPLVTVDGVALGAFCVIDHKPKKLNNTEREYLLTIARQAQAEIDLRLTLSRLKTQMFITEKLLQNILPIGIIERLKNRKEAFEMDVIADSFDSTTIMFVDIVNFTGFAGTVSASQLVHTLGSLFTEFDNVIHNYGVTKIKTIGDGYMVVGGVPDPIPNHAQKIIECGFKLLETVEKHNAERETSFQVRVGINSGPLMAGVVGIDKFTYDCFGDAVNVANRIESTGKPGKIHISEKTYELIKSDFECEKLEKPVDVKGKGKFQTFFVNKQILRN